jgi:hypothetical protein
MCSQQLGVDDVLRHDLLLAAQTAKVNLPSITPTPSATPVPTPAPEIDLDKLTQIQTGMTLDQVNAIIGTA